MKRRTILALTALMLTAGLALTGCGLFGGGGSGTENIPAEITLYVDTPTNGTVVDFKKGEAVVEFSGRIEGDNVSWYRIEIDGRTLTNDYSTTLSATNWSGTATLNYGEPHTVTAVVEEAGLGYTAGASDTVEGTVVDGENISVITNPMQIGYSNWIVVMTNTNTKGLTVSNAEIVVTNPTGTYFPVYELTFVDSVFALSNRATWTFYSSSFENCEFFVGGTNVRVEFYDSTNENSTFNADDEKSSFEFLDGLLYSPTFAPGFDSVVVYLTGDVRISNWDAREIENGNMSEWNVSWYFLESELDSSVIMNQDQYDVKTNQGTTFTWGTDFSVVTVQDP